MIKVGIIGCGKIADQHASEIVNIPGCEIVGVCDKEELMAKQLYDRFKAGGYYDNVTEFLLTAKVLWARLSRLSGFLGSMVLASSKRSCAAA